MSQVLEQALDALLWRRDPLQKAQRAKARDEKKSGGRIKNKTTEVSSHLPAPAQSEYLPKLEASAPAQEQTNGVRVRVPNATRHLIWHKNEGRCSWRYSNGERCSEKKMLEIDHITMVCRGGDNNGENLTLRCRFHNQVRAEQLLGAVFMEGIGVRV